MKEGQIAFAVRVQIACAHHSEHTHFAPVRPQQNANQMQPGRFFCKQIPNGFREQVEKGIGRDIHHERRLRCLIDPAGDPLANGEYELAASPPVQILREQSFRMHSRHLVTFALFLKDVQAAEITKLAAYLLHNGMQQVTIIQTGFAKCLG